MDIRTWIGRTMTACLAVLVLSYLTACSHDEADTVETVTDVKAQLSFSLPSRIAGKKPRKTTRMSSDVVQESGTDDVFRGLDDVHLLCFEKYPTATSTNIGQVIEMKTKGDEVADDVTKEDYSLCQEISIPVGTSHFAFYGAATEDSVIENVHDKYMHFGCIESVGIGKKDYSGNSNIRFRPVSICTSTDKLGNSKRGHDLLTLLNDLMNIKGPEAAPNDKWATVNNIWLNEARQRMVQLTTLSSHNVQTMLGFLNKIIHQEGPDDQGQQLVAAITKRIADCCKEEIDPTSDQIVLKDSLMGFPDDIHLPAGAARIKWNEELSCFEVPDAHAYGNDINVTSVNDYAYPISLQYQIFSNIVASDSLVLFTEPQAETSETTSTQYQNWENLLDSAYADAASVVQPSTQSVAMVKQVQYSVGRLALRTRFTTDNVYDANGKYVDTADGQFTLKGYIIGGQREVDYNFMPVESSRTYAIYDTDMNDGPQELRRRYYTTPDYILGLGTPADKNIYMAVEVVNNGPAFQGADGIIVTGATFYLVANMVPTESPYYVAGSKDRILYKDRATQVNITITSLAQATYGLPNLEIPRPTVGLSVNLVWEEGLWFPDIPL